MGDLWTCSECPSLSHHSVQKKQTFLKLKHHTSCYYFYTKETNYVIVAILVYMPNIGIPDQLRAWSSSSRHISVSSLSWTGSQHGRQVWPVRCDQNDQGKSTCSQHMFYILMSCQQPPVGDPSAPPVLAAPLPLCKDT